MYNMVIKESSITTATFTVTGLLKNSSFDKLAVHFTENSGAVHWTDADMDKVKVMATVKYSNGRTDVVVNARMSDLLKYTNFAGGFSGYQATNNPKLIALIDLGRVVLGSSDEMIIEISGQAVSITPSHYVSVYALDTNSAPARPLKYESRYVASDAVFTDTLMVFQATAVVPQDVLLDYGNGQLSVYDKTAYYVTQASGQFEALVDWTLLHKVNDGSPKSVTLKTPSAINTFVISVA